MTPLTKHLIVELYGCDKDRANDVVYIEKIVKEMLTLVGISPLYSLVFHQQTWGLIATMLFAEGYFGIQTWEKYGYISIDIHFNIDADNEKVLTFLVRKFGATEYSAAEMKRGPKTE
jgi:S-adenosylmethionine/arginine decarboxylase-like enzyme